MACPKSVFAPWRRLGVGKDSPAHGLGARGPSGSFHSVTCSSSHATLPGGAPLAGAVTPSLQSMPAGREAGRAVRTPRRPQPWGAAGEAPWVQNLPPPAACLCLSFLPWTVGAGRGLLWGPREFSCVCDVAGACPAQCEPCARNVSLRGHPATPGGGGGGVVWGSFLWSFGGLFPEFAQRRSVSGGTSQPARAPKHDSPLAAL